LPATDTELIAMTILIYSPFGPGHPWCRRRP